MAAGGRRKGAGRPNGAKNKQKKEFAEVARKYAPEALDILARIMRSSESEAARVSAAKEILDRAYGKAPQAVIGDPDNPIQHEVKFGWMTEKEAARRGWQ